MCGHTETQSDATLQGGYRHFGENFKYPSLLTGSSTETVLSCGRTQEGNANTEGQREVRYLQLSAVHKKRSILTDESS